MIADVEAGNAAPAAAAETPKRRRFGKPSMAWVHICTCSTIHLMRHQIHTMHDMVLLALLFYSPLDPSLSLLMDSEDVADGVSQWSS